MSDILTNAPQDDKYTTIKDRLIALFADAETQKLLTEVDLGDKEPSQLLCEMKNLATDKVTEQFLKTIWLQRLPLEIRSILSISNDDLSKLATMADKMWEMKTTSFQSAAIASQNNDNVVVKLQEKISEQPLQVSELNKWQYYEESRYRSRARSISCNRRNNFEHSTCYYHSKFGDKAFKCNKPCDLHNKRDRQPQEN
nr:uncharacterized protein LOC107453517 [Parasteatoda tepidariorum]